jgi:hypothetical protein
MVKLASKPKASEPSVAELKARIAQLEAEAAEKAAKQTSKRSVRPESPFTAEDVAGMSQQDWFDLKELFIERQPNGQPKLVVGKNGSERVAIVKGLDYGVYRFIKGISRQMRYNDFDGLSEAQVEACRNILAYCLEHDLVESPEATPVETKKPVGRPKGSKNRSK